MKHLLLLGTAVALSFAALGAVGALAATHEVHIGQPQVSWMQPYGPKGPSIGMLEGTFGDKNPASLFVKFAAGGDSGWHFHNEDYSAVVISGTFTEQQAGDAAETRLPIGTYFTQPAKIIHRNGCLKGAECIVYVHFDHGADSTPTTRDGKPLTAAK